MHPKQGFMQQLGIQYPIIQAPMAGVSTPALAAAVSNAGGLGSLGLGASSVEQVEQQLLATRKLTDKPINLNFFCHQPAQTDADKEAAWLHHLQPFFAEFGTTAPSHLKLPYLSFDEQPELLQLLLQQRPAVVSFHFGLPAQAAIDALSDAGIVTIACATTLDEALAAQALGIDAVVAQGAEAGGHRGVFKPEDGDLELGLMALLTQLNEQLQIPLIAAGGIMNGQVIAAALQLGAQAVQLGTAFILTPESAAKAGHRQALAGAASGHTAITSAISGRPARGIVNRFYREVDSQQAPALPAYPIAYDAGKALTAAALAKGNEQFGAYWAGQAAALARQLPAAELMALLVKEWHAASR